MEMNLHDDDKPATQGMLRRAVEPLATKDMLRRAVDPLATKDMLRRAVDPLATKDMLRRLEFKIDADVRSLKNDVSELQEIVKNEVVGKLDYLIGKSKDNDRTTVVFDKRLQDDRERLDDHEARLKNLETRDP